MGLIRKVPEMKDLLDYMKANWPQRKDLNPLTMREEAMMSVVASVIDMNNFRIEGLAAASRGRAKHRCGFQTPFGTVTVEAHSEEAFPWFKKKVGET